MSILTVTLNACVDKTYTVPGFALGRVHRPSQTLVTAGGKGINVARAYRTLGGEATATGFLGGANGDFLQRAMLTEGITPQFVRVTEESRVCIAIMDPVGGTQTELNENGPRVTPADGDALLALLRELLPGRNAVVISGSIPPGTPPTLYRDIVALAQEGFGVRAVLDSSGEALRLGAQARPFLLKPNVHEAHTLGVGAEGCVEAARELRTACGVPLALVTDGPRGAALAGLEGVWEAVPPPVAVASAVGSGDSLTAAFLWGLANGYNEGEALRVGVAAGAANATAYGAAFFSRDLVFALAEQTSVNKRA